MEESVEAAKAFHQVLAILYLLSLTWAILLTPSMKRLGFRVGAVDRPDNARKVHTRIIARFGGPGVFLAFFLTLAALPFIGVGTRRIFRENSIPLLGLFVGAGIVLGAGIYDDVRGLKGRYKFLLIMLASVVLWVVGFRTDRLYIPLPGLGDTTLSWWASLPLTVLWLTLCAAALNFIDGLDGLATGVTLIACITLFFLGWRSQERIWDVMLCSSLIGAVVGFLIFNFHPAKIFLGDSGALFLGFMVGAISVKSSLKSATMATFIVPIMVLGLPILDTVLAVVRRWARHVSIFDGPDRLHLHHRLMDQWGLSQRSAVFVFYLLSILFGGGALLTFWNRGEWRWAPIASVGLLAVLLLAVLRCQEVSVVASRLVNTLLGRERLPQNWMERAPLFEALENADSLAVMWQQTVEILTAFQMKAGRLELDRETFVGLTSEATSWEWTTEEQPVTRVQAAPRWSRNYELFSAGRRFGILHIEHHLADDMSTRRLDRLIDKLTHCLTQSLSRQSP